MARMISLRKTEVIDNEQHFRLRNAYTLRRANMEAHSSSSSLKGTEDVPSNKMGRLDGSSSKRVIKTALSCSCA